MIIKLQGNINDTFENPQWMNQDSLIYCNEGGKSNMSLLAKNIPPMVSDSIPEEIQIKNSIDSSDYHKIRSYNSACMLSASCDTEQPIFRFQCIYDGYSFLYYPEFKLYERPYLILDRNYSIGTDTLLFSTVTVGSDNNKNLLQIQNNDILEFLDTGDKYTVIGKETIGNDISIILNTTLTENHRMNDVVIVKSKRYESKSDSNLMTVANDKTSIFKFKFVDENNLNSKDYAVQPSDTLNDEQSTLLNSNFDDITDIQGDDKIVSLSQNMDISASTIILNNDIDTSDTEIEFSESIKDKIQVNSYFTLKSTDNSIEIMKVKEILSDVKIKVLRSQLNSSVNDFTSAGTKVYFPKSFYFQMIPVNKHIDFRYVVYRNVDFILSQV